MKKLTFVLFIIISYSCFGQLVSGNYHDLTMSISENSLDYERIDTFYKKYTNGKHFVLTNGKQERLKARKDVLYLIEYKQNDKAISIYLFMPFNQTENSQKLEMSFVKQIKFDLNHLKNGTYFIDYPKDLFSKQSAYTKNKDGESLLTITIPYNTIEACKVSNEIIQKEKVKSVHFLEKRRRKLSRIKNSYTQ